MKFIITESKLTQILQKFLDKLHYDEVCKFVVENESDDNQPIWVYVYISEDWYYYEDWSGSMNKVEWVNKIRREVRELIEKMFGIEVRVGSLVKKCRFK